MQISGLRAPSRAARHVNSGKLFLLFLLAFFHFVIVFPFSELLVVNICVQEFIDFLNVHVRLDLSEGVYGYIKTLQVFVDPRLWRPF